MSDDVFCGVPPGQTLAQDFRYDVVVLKPGQRLSCTCLDSRILGLLTHFVYDRDYPRGHSQFCTWEEGGCRRCLAKQVQVWQGYVGVWCHTYARKIVLVLGRESALDLAEYGKRFNGLHLLKFDVYRPETGCRAALVFAESLHHGNAPDLEAFNLQPSLSRVLGYPMIPDYRYTMKELQAGEVPNG